MKSRRSERHANLPTNRLSRRLVALLCLLLLFPVGCKERELASHLSLAESARLMVALHRAGITSEREKSGAGSKERYAITVSEEDFSRALEIFDQYGVGHSDAVTEENFSSIFPPSRELILLELDKRLAVQIERLLGALESIVEVRAVVRGASASSADPAIGAGPRVTIVLRYASPSGHPAFSEDQVRQIVSGIVPNIKAEGLSITSERLVFADGSGVIVSSGKAEGGSAIERLSPLSFHVLSRERSRAQQQVAGVVVVASMSALVIGVYLGWLLSARSLRRRINSRSGGGLSDNFFTEQEGPASDRQSTSRSTLSEVSGQSNGQPAVIEAGGVSGQTRT